MELWWLVGPLIFAAMVTYAWYERRAKWSSIAVIQCLRCGGEDVDEDAAPTFRCRSCGYSPDDEVGVVEAAHLEHIQQLAIAAQTCQSAESSFSRSYRREQDRNGRSKVVRDGAAYLDGLEYVAEIRRIAEEMRLADVVRRLDETPTPQGAPGPEIRAAAMAVVDDARDRLAERLAQVRREGLG